MTTREVPHGGGARGRKNCDCTPCSDRRRRYEREYKQRQRANALGRKTTQLREDVGNGETLAALASLLARADDGWRGVTMSIQAQTEVETVMMWVKKQLGT